MSASETFVFRFSRSNFLLLFFKGMLSLQIVLYNNTHPCYFWGRNRLATKNKCSKNLGYVAMKHMNVDIGVYVCIYSMYVLRTIHKTHFDYFLPI